MRPPFTERSDVKGLAECDPALLAKAGCRINIHHLNGEDVSYGQRGAPPKRAGFNSDKQPTALIFQREDREKISAGLCRH